MSDRDDNLYSRRGIPADEATVDVYATLVSIFGAQDIYFVDGELATTRQYLNESVRRSAAIQVRRFSLSGDGTTLTAYRFNGDSSKYIAPESIDDTYVLDGALIFIEEVREWTSLPATESE